jgi:hypothetical protein
MEELTEGDTEVNEYDCEEFIICLEALPRYSPGAAEVNTCHHN